MVGGGSVSVQPPQYPQIAPSAVAGYPSVSTSSDANSNRSLPAPTSPAASSYGGHLVSSGVSGGPMHGPVFTGASAQPVRSQPLVSSAGSATVSHLSGSASPTTTIAVNTGPTLLVPRGSPGTQVGAGVASSPAGAPLGPGVGGANVNVNTGYNPAAFGNPGAGVNPHGSSMSAPTLAYSPATATAAALTGIPAPTSNNSGAGAGGGGGGGEVLFMSPQAAASMIATTSNKTSSYTVPRSSAAPKLFQPGNHLYENSCSLQIFIFSHNLLRLSPFFSLFA
jgi:hypothetical protein